MVDSAPGGAVHSFPALDGYLVAVFQRANNAVVRTGAAADPQTAVGSDGAGDFVVVAAGIRAAGVVGGTGTAHIYILHTDPALTGAAPGYTVIGKLLKNVDGIALGVGTDGSIAGAGAAADVQTASSSNGAFCGVGAGSSVLIDVVQADPALVGTTPTAALLVNLYAVAVGIAAQTVAVLGSRSADIQLLGDDNAPQLNSCAAVAGDTAGGAAGCGVVIGIVASVCRG